jgi:hypothetical protein
MRPDRRWGSPRWSCRKGRTPWRAPPPSSWPAADASRPPARRRDPPARDVGRVGCQRTSVPAAHPNGGAGHSGGDQAGTHHPAAARAACAPAADCGVTTGGCQLLSASKRQRASLQPAACECICGAPGCAPRAAVMEANLPCEAALPCALCIALAPLSARWAPEVCTRVLYSSAKTILVIAPV